MSTVNFWSKLTVSPKRAKQLLALSIEAGTTAMLWGNYGVGKTSIIYELTEDLKKLPEKLRFDGHVVINPSQTDIIDFKLPYLAEPKDTKDMISRFAYSEMLPREGRWVIFVDEINTAPQSLQPTLYSLILEGRIGNYRLPEGCVRFAAGNREEDGCAAQPMSAALKDRLNLHMFVQPSPADWQEWASKNGIRGDIQAFVQQCPQASLLGHNVDDPTGGCTPRSLEALSKKLNALHRSGAVDEELESLVIQGTIGQGAASVFEGFMRLYRSSVRIDEILKNPTTANVPKDKPDLMYCIAFALVEHIDKKNIDRAITYMGRMPETYSYCTAKSLMDKESGWMNNATFSKFVTSNLGIFI